VKAEVVKNKGRTIAIGILRAGQPLVINTPVSKDGFIGIVPVQTIMDYDSLGYCKLVVTKYSFVDAFPAAFRIANKKLSDYLDQLKKIFSPKTEGYKAVGGFKSMGSMFAPVWDWESFWSFTALLSIILAVMNLLPIPALDGGHVLFTLVEMITGRKPNQKFLEYAQMVGMVLLLGLMLYANGNDWFGWGRGK